MTVKDNPSFGQVILFDGRIKIEDVLALEPTLHGYNERRRRFDKARQMNMDGGKPSKFDKVFVVDKNHAEGRELHCVTRKGIIYILNEDKFLRGDYSLITVLFARRNQVRRLYEAVGLTPPKFILKWCSHWTNEGMNDFV